jgi:hypothetical protein
MDGPRDGRTAPVLLQALFYLVALLVLGAVVYAGWVVLATWDRVGV